MTIKFKPSIVSLIISLSSCSHLYYAPNTQNMPLFKEKNECRLSASVGQETLGSYVVAEIQSAYSLTNHLAVMANCMYVSGGDERINNWGKGRYLEGAFGYYTPVSQYGVFEVYGGFGYAKQYHGYDSLYKSSNYVYGQTDLTFNKIFIQPSIGLTFRAFDIGVSSRISRLNFYDINIQGGNSNSAQNYELNNIIANRTSYLFEPAVTVRGGWKYVKLQLQYVYSANLSNNNINFGYDQISLGLYISFANRYKAIN